MIKVIFIILFILCVNNIKCFFPSSTSSITSLSDGVRYAGNGANPSSITTCDVNGDGIEDMITAYSSGQLVYVYFGPATQFTISNSNLNGVNGFTMLSVLNTAMFCKDINNDGYDDIFFSKDEVAKGSTGVLYGSASPFPSTAFNPIDYINSTQGLSGFYVPSEPNSGQILGKSKNICDFNGDGIQDLTFSSNVGSLGGSGGTKITYVLYGINGGVYPTTNGIFDTLSLTGANGFSYSQNSYHTGCGDINNDGIDDIIINQDQVNIFILYGTSQPYTTGSITPTYDGVNGFKINLFQGTGGVSINSNQNNLFGIGDFNGDGLNDLSFSVRGSSPYFTYLVYGKKEYQSMTLPTYFNDTNGVIFSTTDVNAMCTQNFLKDINGDGLADLQCYGNTFKYNVVYGRCNPLPLNTNVGTLFKTCSGFTNDGGTPFLNSDMNGDGYADITVSTPSNVIVMYGSKYYDLTSNITLKIYKDSTTFDYTPFQNATAQNTGTCPVTFIKFKVQDSNSSDTIELSSIPDPSLYGVINNGNEITVYILDPLTTTFLDDIFPLLTFKSSNYSQNSTLSFNIGGINSNIVDFIAYIDIPTTSTTSLITTSTTASDTTSTTTSDTTSTTTSTTTSDTTSTTTSTSNPTSSSSTTSNSPSDVSKNDKSKVGVIVGPIVGGVFLIAFLLIFAVLYKKKKNKNNKGKKDKENTPPKEVERQVSMVQIFTGGKIENIDKF